MRCEWFRGQPPVFGHYGWPFFDVGPGRSPGEAETHASARVRMGMVEPCLPQSGPGPAARSAGITHSAWLMTPPA